MTIELRVETSIEAARAALSTPGLAGYGFQTAAWLGAWTDTMGAAARARPLIVIVVEAGAVRMVVPLCLVRRAGLRRIMFLGGLVTDYNAPLVDPAFAASLDRPAMAALWARIVAVLPRHDVIDLERMPDWLDPEEPASEPVANPFALLPGATSAGVARAILLPATPEAQHKAMRKGFVQDMRRRWRRLAERGAVAFEVVEGDARTAVVDALMAMKSRRWRDTGGADWSTDPGFRAFYLALAHATLPEGCVHVSVLRCGETIVAAHLGIVHRGRFYLLLVGWAGEEWAFYGTGRLMTDAMVRWSIENALRVFDFTTGEDAYKRDWANAEMPLWQLRHAVTLRGHAAVRARATIERTRTALKRSTWLRAQVRRLAGRPPLPRKDAA